MKKYEIITKADWEDFKAKLESFFKYNEKQGLPFKKLNITVKSWRKDKTSKQHRFYWVVVNEMTKGFLNAGYQVTRDDVHEFIKKANGYTQEIVDKNGNVTTITKSIADTSEDVNVKVMMDLIDFAIRWSAINLDWVIEDPRSMT